MQMNLRNGVGRLKMNNGNLCYEVTFVNIAKSLKV